MRVHSNKKPEKAFTITVCDDKAEIVFCSDITEEEEGYSYEELRLCVPYRDNLEECVAKNTDGWKAKAMEKPPERLTLSQQVQRLRRENALMGEALTELILTMEE